MTPEQIAALSAALADLDFSLSEMGGCSDGNCIVVKPKGMHTNGGCRCLYHDHIRTQRFAHAHNRFVTAVRKIITKEAAPPTEAAPVSQTVQDAASSNAEIVVPYGSRNGATHLRTQGDNLTFCGRDSAAWSVVDGSVTEALESSFTCKLCLNAMSTTGDPSAEATPVVLRAKEIAASALQTACETDPADPEHPDTVMLTTGDFETIVRLAIENSCEGNPTEAAIRADEREKCLKIVQAHCCTGVDGDFYKGINSACDAIEQGAYRHD